MMKRPIKVKHKVYSKSIFPPEIWILMILCVIAGYFAGGVLASFAQRKEIEKTQHYFMENSTYEL